MKFFLSYRAFSILALVSARDSNINPGSDVVIGTDCIDNCKTNYHKITATTIPSCMCKQCRCTHKLNKRQRSFLDNFFLKFSLTKMQNVLKFFFVIVA
jgi:hypothetical protein